MKNRKAYVKQISKSLYHICLEYGAKDENGVANEKILKKFNNLDKAIKHKNNINNRT